MVLNTHPWPSTSEYTYLKQLGFTRSEIEATIYQKQDQIGPTLIVSLYVDDMLVTSNDLELLKKIKKDMQKSSEMSNLGLMKYFLALRLINAKLVCLYYKKNMFQTS